MRPMRSMFHKKHSEVPSLNVASMPDLIFTVLFFFMIVTHMRSDEVKVRLEVPAGSEVKKLAGHPAIVNIYIGKVGPSTGLGTAKGNGPSTGSGTAKGNGPSTGSGTEWAVQLNGDIVSPKQIPARISEIRGKLSPENAERLTVSLRADRHAPMGIVNDVKQALQKSYALKINYSATEINP